MPATPDLWEELTREAVNGALREGKLKATLVTQRAHPELFESIAELSQKAGLAYIPRVLITNEIRMGPVWARKLPNAGAVPGLRVVMMNKSLLDLGGSALSRPMTPEVETVMAHEFSHLKDGALHMLSGRLPVVTLPMAAMAGLFLYDRAVARTAHAPDQGKEDYCNKLAANMHKAADEEIAKCHEAASQTGKWTLDPDWQESVVNAGRYALAAAIGLGGGLLMARRHSLQAEFRADRMAVELTGKPEALKQILIQIEGAFKQAARTAPTEPPTFAKQVKDQFHWLMAKTVHAHPRDAERFSHIDQVARSMQALGGAAVQL